MAREARAENDGLLKRSASAVGKDFQTAFSTDVAGGARTAAVARVTGVTSAVVGGGAIGIVESIRHGGGVFNALGSTAAMTVSSPVGIATVAAVGVTGIFTIAGRVIESDHLANGRETGRLELYEGFNAASVRNDNVVTGRTVATASIIGAGAIAVVGGALDVTLSHLHGMPIASRDLFTAAEAAGAVGATFGIYSGYWSHRASRAGRATQRPSLSE